MSTSIKNDKKKDRAITWVKQELKACRFSTHCVENDIVSFLHSKIVSHYS